MKSNPWFKVSIADGHLNLTSEDAQHQQPKLTFQEVAVIYTYSLQHKITRIQIAEDGIRLEHENGMVERFNSVVEIDRNAYNVEGLVTGRPGHGKSFAVLNEKITKKRKVTPINWRKSQDVDAIIKVFPKAPKHDEVLDLHALNKTLRSNKLENFIRVVGQIAKK